MKQKEEKMKVFHQKGDEMLIELAKIATMGIVGHWSQDFMLTVRAVNKHKKQQVYEKLKTLVRERNLRIRILLGQPCVKRCIELPARTAFQEIIKLFQEITGGSGKPTAQTLGPAVSSIALGA